MAWTEEMVEELKRLWAEGVTTGEIGRRLNISKNSIVGKVHRLGLSGRPSPIKKKSDTPAAEKEQPVKTAKTTKPATKPAAKTPATKSDASAKEAKPTPAPATSKQKIESQHVETFEEDVKLAKSLNLPFDEPAKKEFLSLTDLDNHTCRWPIGDPKDENFHFCGKKVRLGQTYCEEHATIAYVSKAGKK